MSYTTPTSTSPTTTPPLTEITTIYKSNKVIGYLLVVEVAWGNLLMEVTGGSAIKARGIHYVAVRVYRQLADEVLDSLEGWF